MTTTTGPQSLDILQGLLEESSAVRGEWINSFPGRLPSAALEPSKAADAAIQKAKDAITGTRAAIERLRADDMIPPAGRDRQIREHLDTAKTTLTEQIRRADGAFTIMRGTLTDAALPKVTTGNELLARHDAQMILDRAKDPHAAMIKLAERGDDIGALVASPWGQDYLAARGVDLPIHHQTVIHAAVGAAAEQSTDLDRQSAARHLQHMDLLLQARDMVANGAYAVLNNLGA